MLCSVRGTWDREDVIARNGTDPPREGPDRAGDERHPTQEQQAPEDRGACPKVSLVF